MLKIDVSSVDGTSGYLKQNDCLNSIKAFLLQYHRIYYNQNALSFHLKQQKV